MDGHRLASDYLIFPPGPGDAEDLAEVHVRAWRQTYGGLLPDFYLARLSVPLHARRWRKRLLRATPGEVDLTAGDRSGLVGYVSGGPLRGGSPDEAEITTLYVLQSAQGQGLGRRLLGSAARAMMDGGLTSLSLTVLRGNDRAVAFYDRLGGVAGPAQVRRGPGGGLVSEIPFNWPDIAELAAVADAPG
jgi:ribosomal protein S18 acetylase RimI-like enzyme